MSRKGKTNDECQIHRFQVYVNKDERAIIEAFAREKNLTVSKYLRELPGEYMRVLLQYRAED